MHAVETFTTVCPLRGADPPAGIRVREARPHSPAQAVPAAAALAMRDRLWAFMPAMHGRRPDDPATWRWLDGRTRFKMLMRTGAFDAPTCSDQPGAGLRTGAARSSLSRAPITRGRYQRSAAAELPGLVMPGSHHLTWRLCQRAGGFMRTGDMKAVLAGESTWLADLWREPGTDRDDLSRFFDDGAVIDGTRVRVAELCGQPGAGPCRRGTSRRPRRTPVRGRCPSGPRGPRPRTGGRPGQPSRGIGQELRRQPAAAATAAKGAAGMAARELESFISAKA
jgi:hypothetical protein